MYHLGSSLRAAVAAVLLAVAFGHGLTISKPACGAVLKPGQADVPIAYGDSHEAFVTFILAKTPPPLDSQLTVAFSSIATPAGLSALGTVVSANNPSTANAAKFTVPSTATDGSYCLIAVWHELLTTNASWSAAGGTWGHLRSSDEFLIMAADPSPQLSIAVAPERVNVSLAVPTPFHIQSTGTSWVSYKGMTLAANIPPTQPSVLLHPGTPFDLRATLRAAKPSGPFLLYSRASDGALSYAVSECWNSRFPAAPAAAGAGAAGLAPVRASFSDVAVSAPGTCAAGDACPLHWALAAVPSPAASVRVEVYAGAEAAPLATLAPPAGAASASFAVPAAAAPGSTLYAVVSVGALFGASPLVFVAPPRASSASASSAAASPSSSSSEAAASGANLAAAGAGASSLGSALAGAGLSRERLDEAWTMGAAGSALGASAVGLFCVLFVMVYPGLAASRAAARAVKPAQPAAP
eukprot:tig00000383_g24626.t1